MKRFSLALITAMFAVSLCGCGGIYDSSGISDSIPVESAKGTKANHKKAPDESYSEADSPGESAGDKSEVSKLDDNTVYTPEADFEIVKYDDGATEIIGYLGDSNTVNIPDGVTSIGKYAFANCTSLTNIIIPNSVTSVGESAFRNCTNLTSITIPNSVIFIDDSADSSAFMSCNKSLRLTYKGQTYDYSQIDELYFAINDGISEPDNTVYSPELDFEVEEVDGGVAIVNYLGEDIEVNIPKSIGGKPVVKISTSWTYEDDPMVEDDRYAFSGCFNITSISIPDSVISIGPAAFYMCTNLKSIEIPDSVISIGDIAFCGCDNLTSVDIPDSVVSIGKGAFGMCSNLMNIVIPNSVTSMDINAFAGCSSLTDIVLSNSIKEIGGGAFTNCTALTSITIPNSVISIGEYAFYGCTSLMNISLSNSLASISDFTFGNCSSLVSITIPDGVTSIGEEAFSWCENLESVTLPESVTSIGDLAFSWCSCLESINIPKKINHIGEGAFFMCHNVYVTYKGKRYFIDDFYDKLGIGII